MHRNNSEAPALKLAGRLRLEIELAVRRFSRLDRHSIGQVLREEATTVARLASMAWREPSMRTQHLLDLTRAHDALSQSLKLAQEDGVRAFSSIEVFAAIQRTSAELGRQVGGWSKKQHAKGQNAPASAPAQRASILSADAAQQRGAQP